MLYTIYIKDGCKMNERAKYWLELSEYDLETAKAMFTTKRYLYVGFMCHQIIEKALKAVISNDIKDSIPAKTHDLVKLAKISGIYSKISENQKDFIDLLLPLNIEARYPTYKEQLLEKLTSNKCLEIINKTEEFLLWIKQQL